MRLFIHRYELQFIAFIVGVVVMVLEMVGSRILSPYFGVSINTWTILIGIILGSLSLGYWYGGIYADKGVQKESLAQLLCGVGIYVVAIGLVHDVTMNLVLSIPNITLLWGCFLSAMLFFVFPNILLGMVNPYLAKLMITSLKSSGSRVGNLSAISTFGNIVGTFSASFVLIPTFGITMILIIIGFVLVLLSILLCPPKYGVIGLILAIFSCIIFVFHPRYVAYLKKAGLVDIDTQYGKVFIYKQKNSSYLITGAFGYESKNTSTNPTPYLPNLDQILTSLLKSPKAALVIGGGTFNVSNYLLTHYPFLKVDSVEIDKKIAEIAYSYFGYQENVRHQIIIEDGRTFINKSQPNRYDFIINDAYQDIIPPYHLLTQEAVKKIYIVLRNNGIFISNVASALEGEKSWLLKSSYSTVSSVFPYVIVIPLEKNSRRDALQSVLLIASKNSLPTLSKYEWKEKKESHVILTDDFAPVEYNLTSITSGRSAFHLSRYYLTQLVDNTYKYLLSEGTLLISNIRAF